MKGIAVAGTILVDNLNEIERYPNESELVTVKKITKAVGGCVPNVAIDLKRISPENEVYAYGKVGDDDNGAYVKGVLKSEKVDISGISLSSDMTSKTEVMSVVGGQRTFFTYPGASKDFGFDDIDFDKGDFSMLHLGYFLLLKKVDGGDGLKILKEAKRRGIKTSIDMVSRVSTDYGFILKCLEYTDNLIINEIEAGFLTGMEPKKENLAEMTKKLLGFGVKERVIIHMPKLAVLRTSESYIVLPSYKFPKEKVVGTTGAGDAFCAGALIGIYKNYNDDEILSLASSAALVSLRSADATGGVVSEEEIKKYCENLERLKLCL